MKIAINRCYGGFGLSPLATQLYLKKLGKKCYFYKQTKYSFKGEIPEYTKITTDEATKSSFITILIKDYGEIFKGGFDNDDYFYVNFNKDERGNKLLIEVIEELGEKESSSNLAKIQIVEIPDGVEYEIDDYDGIESIHEKHRIW